MVFKKALAIVIILSACGIMLKLGFWQIDRLEWKEGIIADIQTQENINPSKTKFNIETAQRFERGYIDGFLSASNAVYIEPRTVDGEVGAHVIMPFSIENGPVVFLNLGWLPKNTKVTYPDLRPGRFVGHFRNPDDQNSFTPNNQPETGRWYWADVEALKEDYNIYQDVHPMLFYVENQFGNIKPHEGLPYPRNKHAQYAAFWFGMAGLLLLLCGLYIWKNRK